MGINRGHGLASGIMKSLWNGTGTASGAGSATEYGITWGKGTADGAGLVWGGRSMPVWEERPGGDAAGSYHDNYEGDMEDFKGYEEESVEPW